MDALAGIGPSISIKGDVTTEEPLMIAGHVVGTISANGHQIIVADSGDIAADIRAHTIVVGGHVNGKLSADARIVVRETAIVDGELSAPAVIVDEGATLRGRFEIAGRR
jgi:cytoskeletal protein CcmA (bactofilin family)